MRGRALVVVVLCLSVLTPAAQAQRKRKPEKRDTYELKGVAVVNGKADRQAKARTPGGSPLPGASATTPHGTLITYRNGHERVEGWDGWYLNYGSQGQGRCPRSGARAGAWLLLEVERRRLASAGVEGYDFKCTVRPLNGPMRTWYLAIKDDRSS